VTRDAVACADGRVHVHNGLSANDQELIELYRMADLFVLPTQADCYSIAAIEAMAAGLPVVLTAIGGTPDIIRNGKTGFLSEPGDSRGFSDALGTLINDAALRKSMGAAARADAEKRFDVRKNIVKIVSEMTRQVRP
jgi:glycosyltransferase involved in cell wall biosynthesis